MIDERYLRNLLHAVERYDVAMYYRDGMLYVELDGLPDWLQRALRENVGPMCRLVSRIGTRVGFRRVRARWHLAVNKIGYLESACGTALLDQPPPVRELPTFSGPDDKLCARCVRHMVARELARIPTSSHAWERRV